MACLADEDLLLNTASAFTKNKTKHENLDSDDKEVEDLFKDSSDSNEVIKSDRQTPLKSKNGRGKCDVNFDDLMQASVATDFKPH